MRGSCRKDESFDAGATISPSGTSSRRLLPRRRRPKLMTCFLSRCADAIMISDTSMISADSPSGFGASRAAEQMCRVGCARMPVDAFSRRLAISRASLADRFVRDDHDGACHSSGRHWQFFVILRTRMSLFIPSGRQVHDYFASWPRHASIISTLNKSLYDARRGRAAGSARAGIAAPRLISSRSWRMRPA